MLRLLFLLPLAACAQPHDQGLSAPERHQIRQIMPDADLSNLTQAQIGALQAALYGNEFEAQQKVRAILN